MADTKLAVGYDIDGYDQLTAAIGDLLQRYPGLRTGEAIGFSKLQADTGRAWFPTSGALIRAQRTSITGWRMETCAYPFTVVYRAAGLSEDRKAAVKEWLDDLGRWLEGQTITVNGAEHRLAEYPALKGTRRITRITRSTPAYLESIEANMAENWVIAITAEYRNEYQKEV